MIWLTWRQFRPGAITAGAALVALAAALLATRPAVMSLYTSAGLASCHAACAADANKFLDLVQRTEPAADIRFASIGMMYAVPALLGLFWGAPLIAHELGSGTFRLVWTQSVTRARWVTVKLILIGAAAMLTAGLGSLLIEWWSSPLYQAAGESGRVMTGGLDASGTNRLLAPLFSTTGIVPLGYAAFAFALGAAAGVLLRRTLPAMAVTLAVFVAIQILVPIVVRPHLIPPVHTTSAVTAVVAGGGSLGPSGWNLQVLGISGQPGAWILGNRMVNAAGHAVTTLPAACFTNLSANFNPDPCLARHGLKLAITYQPASRYWELQGAETALYLVLAAGLGWLCYLAVRRRQRAA